MQGKWCYFFFLWFGLASYGQTCPRVNVPQNGSINVPVDVTITWDRVDGIVGYLISLGTTPGGVDILNRRSAGQVNSFTPPVGLPENTEIFVTISLFLPNQPLLVCPGESFRTIDVTTPPPCTSLRNPSDGDGYSNGQIHWDYAPTATGYRVSIGSTPGGVDITDNVDVGNQLLYRPLEVLPLDTPIFVRIRPYNENGDSPPCAEENYTLGVPEIDCGIFIPNIDLSSRVGICGNDFPVEISTATIASGYRWFKIMGDGSEVQISERLEVAIGELGRYRLEAYNIINHTGVDTECSASKEFEVIASGPAVIEAVALSNNAQGLRIVINAVGTGDYEYALNQENGTYYDSPIFDALPTEEHTIFVRDKNGCGTVSRVVARDVSVEDFPRFFTPNGDGYNDFWQFVPPNDDGEIIIATIFIFDRQGRLLVQIDPTTKGWDGNYQGRPLPSSDYWYKAISLNRKAIKGNFTLKR